MPSPCSCHQYCPERWKPKPVPRGSCLCLAWAGWSLCCFYKHLFCVWCGTHFPARAGACAAQWDQELGANRTGWEQTLSSGMSPPSCCWPHHGRAVPEWGWGQAGWDVQGCVCHTALCAFSQGHLLCAQVKDACPGCSAQVTNWGGELRELATSKLSDMMPTKGNGGKQSCLFQCILKCTPPPCKENICFAFCSLRHGHLLI